MSPTLIALMVVGIVIMLVGRKKASGGASWGKPVTVIGALVVIGAAAFQLVGPEMGGAGQVLEAYEEVSGEKLGNYLSSEENLSSAVVITDTQEQQGDDEKSQLKGFRSGFNGQIVAEVSPNITDADREEWREDSPGGPGGPEGETGVSRPSDWFKARHLQEIVSQYSGQADVIVSLIGIPSGGSLGDILGGSDSPKVAVMNESEDALGAYGGLFREGTIVAAVVELPFSERRENVNYDDPAMPPSDVDKAFSNMYELITTEDL